VLHSKDGAMSSINSADQSIDCADIDELFPLHPAPNAIVADGVPLGAINPDCENDQHDGLYDCLMQNINHAITYELP
jgi:hypothetical protein